MIEALAWLVRRRGAPQLIRSDNGPEFLAKVIRAWLATAGVGPLYVAPGAPGENGYAESFHSRLRDELVNTEEFESSLEARVLTRQWQHEYNHKRRHSALGYQSSAAYAANATVTIDPTLTATGI